MTGMLKDAETSLKPVGTSGSYAVRPSGGFDPLNQDLRLYEVNVTSLREVRPPVRRFRPIAEAPPDAAVQRAPIAPTEPEAPPIETARDPEPGTFSANLPQTASPLPFAVICWDCCRSAARSPFADNVADEPRRRKLVTAGDEG